MTGKCGIRLTTGIPEELAKFAANFLDSEEEIEKNEKIDERSGKMLYELTKFLFQVAKTRSEKHHAIQMSYQWAKKCFFESEDKEKGKWKICKKIEKLAIKQTLKSLPDSCSLIRNFPLKLKKIKTKRLNFVKVKAAARIDIAGGWTDTPPITYDMDSPAVLNAAILVDGKRPITAEIHRLEIIEGIWVSTGEGTLRCFESEKEVWENATIPNESGSLICAVIVTAGIFRDLLQTKTRDLESFETFSKFNYQDDATTGLLIKCHSDLPHGSGLGTSSILSGAVLAGLWTFFGRKFTDDDLIKGVLKVEQFHTTGGGWQDQVGGLIPGIKISTLKKDVTRSVIHKQIHLPNSFETEINSRLVLVYTGKTRLAKNLLDTVILNWIRGDLEIELDFRSLAYHAQSASKKIAGGHFPIDEIEEYHELKKKLATGAEPNFIKELIHEMKHNKFIETAWIAGAGGGGFLYVFLEKNKTIQELGHFLEGKNPKLKVSSIKIDNEVLEIQTL